MQTDVGHVALLVPSFQTNTCKTPSSGLILRFQGKDSHMFCLQARLVVRLQPDTLLGWYVPLGARAAIPALRMNPASPGGKPRALLAMTLFGS